MDTKVVISMTVKDYEHTKRYIEELKSLSCELNNLLDVLRDGAHNNSRMQEPTIELTLARTLLKAEIIRDHALLLNGLFSERNGL